MRLHLCEQRTPEWIAARAAKITASESGPFLMNSKTSVALKARQNLIDKKLAEWAGEFEGRFENDAMKRGIALEGHARAQYAAIIGLPVVDVGFAEMETYRVGCSPDGAVLSSLPPMMDETAIAAHLIGGVEIKAPSGSTQVRYLREKVLPEEYKFQVHHTMAVMGTPWWDFFSFCPLVTEWEKTRAGWTAVRWENGKLPVFHIRTCRNDFTEQLSDALKDFSNDLTQQIEWLKNL